MLKGRVKEKWKGETLVDRDPWSDVHVSRNWYRTVSNVYENLYMYKTLYKNSRFNCSYSENTRPIYSTFYWEFVPQHCAKQNNAKAQFCTKWSLRMFAQSAILFEQNCGAAKAKICAFFRKNCAKVLRMKILIKQWISRF